MEFRKDINGLRALAVASVFLFHLGVAPFSGGFVGVDIFFVISGFLMTGIIYTGVKNKSFSVSKFWLSRAKRIMPALFFVIAVCFLLGYFYLVPNDYRDFSRKAFYSLSFFSNNFYAQKIGYFEQGEQTNWLLHTWSLSAEWQFYMLLPFIIIGLKKFKNGKYLLPILALITFVSFVLSAFLTPLYPKESFFLLHTRIYEFLLGGFVFLFKDIKTKNKYLSEIGLFFIFLAVFLYNDKLAFPSHYSLLPVLGTVFIIRANKTSFILDNPISQYLGKISYSIYLWHFPLIAAVKYLEIDMSATSQVLIFLLAVSAAQLSYQFVEQPFRNLKLTYSNKALIYKLSGVFCVMLVLLKITSTSGGLPYRMPDDIAKIADKHLYAPGEEEKCKTLGGNCVMGSGAAVPSVAVWGDSHAHAFMKVFDDLLGKLRGGLIV